MLYKIKKILGNCFTIDYLTQLNNQANIQYIIFLKTFVKRNKYNFFL